MIGLVPDLDLPLILDTPGWCIIRGNAGMAGGRGIDCSAPAHRKDHREQHKDTGGKTRSPKHGTTVWNSNHDCNPNHLDS